MPVHNIFTVLNKLTFLFLYGNCNYNYIIKHAHSNNTKYSFAPFYTQRHENIHNDQLIGIKKKQMGEETYLSVYIKLTTPIKQLRT